MQKLSNRKISFINNKDSQLPPAKFDLLPKIINGGIAGIVGVSIVFPIDLVKTRLQNQPLGANGERQYKNMLDCFKQTYRAEGYFGMYRGAFVTILFVTPEKAIKLSANDMFRYYLTRCNGELSTPRQMLAGGMAGACQISITTPMELLKIQMQDSGRLALQAKKEGKKFVIVTTIQFVKRLLKERGILGLYRGYTACAGRDITFSIFYFPLFAWLNNLGAETHGGPVPFWCTFMAGLVAAGINGLAVTPFDVIKTRMQAASSSELKYISFWDCLWKTLKYEGPTALFKGGVCRVLVLAPLYGIAQAVYRIGIGEHILGTKV